MPAGQIVSQGYNLENTNQCAFNAVGDKKNLNPLLDRLRYNGGASRTMYLKPAARDRRGDPESCGQFDQRGFYGTREKSSSGKLMGTVMESSGAILARLNSCRMTT